MRRAPRVGLLVASASLATVAASPCASAALVRNPSDRDELALLRERAPRVAQLLEDGERLAAAGSFEPAAALFAEARAGYAYAAGLAGRRLCEARTAMGQRDEALDACWRSMQDEHTTSTVAATVRALVTGPIAPTVAQVGQALALTTMERARAPGQPQLAAAMCDIAESLGDGIMLQRCAEELERIAPDYEPTRRAEATLRARCPPWRFWSGWGLVSGAVLATATDWMRRLARKVPRRARATGTAGLAAAALVLAAPGAARAAGGEYEAHGGMLSQWPIDDNDPGARIPTEAQRNADPLEFGYWLQDLTLKAEVASKNGDHAAAVRYYKAMFKAVPDRAVSLARLCDEYEAMGDLDDATAACGTALLVDGVTVGDYSHYVTLMLRKPGPLTAQEKQALTNVIGHMKQEEAGREAGYELECEFGLRVSDGAMLRECTTALSAVAPDDPKTLSYGWALAVQQGHFSQARQFLARARDAGMNGDGLRRMESATSTAARKQLHRRLLTGFGVALLAGALVYGLRLLARRRERPAADPGSAVAPSAP